MPRTAIIGHTGFVGRTLSRSRSFDEQYNSSNIDALPESSFDLVICAGAPAMMWAANANPEQDQRNLDRLAKAILLANIERLILISTVAVFDDVSKGYTEKDASYETQKAYGRNRRALEEALINRPGRTQIVRLPALFGRGLKKNFIFDLMNPVPSFLKPEKWNSLLAQFDAADARLAGDYFELDQALGMLRYDRARAQADKTDDKLAKIFVDAGFTARLFTNSASAFQCYHLERLADDVETVIEEDIDVLNICSQPLHAFEIHESLTGYPFENAGPPIIKEDVRTLYGDLFGGSGPYHFSREQTMQALRAFFDTERPW